MPVYDFDRLIDRHNTAALKWDVYAGRDVLPMWVADMDFQSPPEVIEALTERVEHGVFGYTLAPRELGEVIVERLYRLYGWRIDADWLVWLPGGVVALNAVCRAFAGPRRSVLTQVPIYPPFLSAPSLQGSGLQTCRMVNYSGRWEIDFGDMERAADASTSLYLFCNPHNPCGRVFELNELERIADFCLSRNVMLCSDEVHCDLLFDDRRHLPIAAAVPQVADRTITIMAPSKTFNLAGLGLSFAVVPNREMRTQLRRAMEGIVAWPNALAYTAALAAYRHGEPWLKELLVYLRRNRDQVEERLNRLHGISCLHVEATYLAWLDVRSLGLENPKRFFEDAGVGLSDGRDFGGEGFLRLNFGCPRSMLDEALGRMEAAVTSL